MSKENLVWIDMEMTGLSPEKNQIIEVALIITDKNLNSLEEINLIIHAEDEVLDNMDEWNTTQHGKTGLIEEARKSTLTVKEAEKQVLDLVKKHCGFQESPLCGNSVYFDRMFMRKYMPELNEYLHYRLVDTSSFKEIVRRWYGESLMLEKKEVHRALDDIKESIDELKHYREKVFK